MESQESIGAGPGSLKLSRWPYTPQLIVFILLLVAGGFWIWWTLRGDWILQVNGVKISGEAWQAETASAEIFLSQDLGVDFQGPGAEDLKARVGQMVLQNMVDRVLLRQAAVYIGIRTAPAEVDAQIATDIARSGGADKFRQELQKRGLTQDQYREKFQIDLTIYKLYEQVTRDVKVNEEELKAAYRANFTPEVKYEEVRESLRQNLLTGKKNNVFQEYLERLQEHSRVMYR